MRERPARPLGRLEAFCVVLVLLAVALLVAYVALNWSTGRTNVLG
jgi:hypothetical protein